MSEEPDFAYGDALSALFDGDPEQLMRAIIPNATLAAELDIGWLLAWPNVEMGIMAFILRGEDCPSSEHLAQLAA